jgi:hypothetical protein
MEKRAFKRRILRLKGVCSAPGMGSRVVEIRDFCPGGMLLSFPGLGASEQARSFSPVYGDVVDIRCNVPSFHHNEPILFRGRIVRLDADGAGLAFIDPDFDALHSLHTFVKQRPEVSATSRQSGNAANETSLSPSDFNKRALLETSREMAQACLEPLIDGFLDQASNRLLSAAEVAQSIPEKNAFYNAANVLRQQADTLKSTFVSHASQRLNQTPGLGTAQSQAAKAESSNTTLSLIEDDVFEEWLAFSDMARKAESACLEQLSDLTHRVGVLFHAPIDKENNPFGPVAFGEAFQETIRNLGFVPSTLHLLYAIYRDELITRLDPLYRDINEYLIKNGVLSDLRHKYKVKRAAESVSPTRPEDISSPQEALTVGAPLTPGEAETGQAEPSGSLQTSSAPRPAEQDWYRLVQNINDLQKQVAGNVPRASQSGHVPVALHAPDTEPRYYTPQELTLALSRLGSASNKDYPVAQYPQEIRSQLLSVLTTGKPTQEQKLLPGREEKILDMAGNLLESVLTDKLISNNVRPWLQQLSIPIFKIALNR